MKSEPYLIPYTKINSKWISNLNIRAKTIELLEENTRVSLDVLGFGNRFLDMKCKAQSRKEKIDKLYFIKIKNFCIKEHYQESEKTAYRRGENICKSYI